MWSNANGNHPLDSFWPRRFLKFSGDAKPFEFSMVEKESSWLPFGSGANLWLGQQFAKLHCVVTLAIIVDSFECDILGTPEDLKLDLKKFRIEVLSLKSKVPARLRRRERSS